MQRLLAVLLFFGIPARGFADETPADWPQWRGPSRDGQVAGTTWPQRLTPDNFRQSWRVPVGPGYSGPIVAADRVFVAETKDRKLEVVRALDRATGKELWQTRWEGAMTVPFFARANGDWIRSTPAYDGANLYVAGMRDLLVCLDAQTGKERWRFDPVAAWKTPLPPFGFVCSPLVDDQAVYVQAGAAVVKLDKSTGKPLWKALQADGNAFDSAFSSPAVATLGGKRQLLVQTRTTLAGLDPETGGVLWSQAVPAFRNMNILTPTVFGDGVFTSAYGSRSFFYRVAHSDGQFSVKEAWTNKLEGYMSTPVVIDGHAYLHLRNQRFACIDLKNGETRWTTDERFGQYWSLIVQGDRILALDQRGILYLIRATPKSFDLVGELKIADDSTWAHLAISGDEVFIRELNAIAAYRWRDAK